MSKPKSKPNLPASFALSGQHIEFTIPQSVEQCLHHLQSLNRVPDSWLEGGRPDVNFVPMGDDLTKFHVLRRTGMNIEVEAVGTLQRITERSTVVVGFARLPQSSVLTLVFHAAMLIAGIFFIQVLVPSVLGRPYVFAVPLMVIWSLVLVAYAVRAIYARNRLIHLISEALEMDRY
jgi:hypothetical protein